MVSRHQEDNDAGMALRALKNAFHVDVEPILAAARVCSGGAIDPVAAYRDSGYRERVGAKRGSATSGGSGIV